MVLSRILELLRETNFECPQCGHEPEIPMDEFTVAEPMRTSDFTEYECPECGDEFEAVLCRCGSGYTSFDDFDEVRERNTGRDEYVCDCGSTLIYR
jgi:predicted RNA-binding Zn-ribbon protein involved in translation (DUF1610 family)